MRTPSDKFDAAIGKSLNDVMVDLMSELSQTPGWYRFICDNGEPELTLSTEGVRIFHRHIGAFGNELYAALKPDAILPFRKLLSGASK